MVAAMAVESASITDEATGTAYEGAGEVSA